jgi:hypothetical protein
MYGTVARMRVKRGMLEEFYAWNEENRVEDTGPGAMLVFQMDDNPHVLYLVVAAESRESYRAVADRPEMHARFMDMMQYLEAEPEWHDGEVVASEFNL